MKKLGLSMLLGLAALMSQAQDQPNLSISTSSPQFVQLNWTNQVGFSYRVLFTSDLTSPLSSWTPLEDAFSQDTLLSVQAPISKPVGFFNVEIPTNSGVQIFSPTNAQTVSGVIAIRGGVQIGGQVQGVNLYLDDALVGFIDSGGVEFDLDTSHFTNGVHTLYLMADNTGNGETASDPITLDFENSVRWLDATSLFQAFVPITVQSDIFPADWSVFVQDSTGATIRTFSGSTSDGLIQTNWDGTDDGGSAVPDEASYKVTIAVASSGSFASPLMSIQSSTEMPAPDPMTPYLKMLEAFENAPDELKPLYPPLELPSLTASDEETMSAPLPTPSPMATFMTQHGMMSADATPMGGSPGSGGSTGTITWREKLWNSGQIVLARQKVTGFAGLTFDGVVANLFNNVQNLVADAQGSVSGDRSVYQGSVFVMQHNGDFGAVKTALSSIAPNTREFYFWGHGGPDGNSIGFRDGTPNDGIKAKELAGMLTNSYTPVTNGSPALFTTTKPFDFVFLDGCMTGKGSFPEAFGIPKDFAGLTYDNNHRHKRAFMGWGGTISLSILDTESLNWSLSFWKSWLGDVNKSVIQSQTEAYTSHPSGGDGAPLLTYGNKSLKWGD